ncbi:hypothetical protein A0J61_00205 [Choanephora cucurbitarum]|uniref:BZIP domain-containing protein n=1 Tax=Choanephora cucurbitarum TaxID=101091 RepID=A0A1C7NRX6_9FUNG|nr:hypothetical protein A0J61_00205 [Choanephora cucurbitarum]
MQQQQPPLTQQQQQASFSLSDADLFQFLLGEEAQQAGCAQLKPNEDSSCKFEDSSSSETQIAPKKRKQTSSGGNKPPASTTSRLDFRPINDHIPESQLKAMSSKERRQLRNKISARNFRNRRKEYVGSLEDELNQQKAENSQLKLELKWLKTKVDKLQKENDKLRVDLVLSGINMPTDTQQPTPLFDNTSLLNSTLNLSNSSSSSSSSSDESTLSSPPNLFTDFPDNWDFVLPGGPGIQNPNNGNTNTYLSHALVPHWNMNQVLSKETSSHISNDASIMFQQYPLLAPALMSIVLAHTMTMSTEELLATARLSPSGPLPPPSTFVHYDEKNPFTGSTIMTDKEAKAVWEILEPLTFMKERRFYLTENEEQSAEVKQVHQKMSTIQDSTLTTMTMNACILITAFCPLVWLQHRLGRYLCELAAAQCEAGSNTHFSTLSQEEEGARETEEEEEDPIDKKFILCRQFHKVKRYIATTCQ